MNPNVATRGPDCPNCGTKLDLVLHSSAILQEDNKWEITANLTSPTGGDRGLYNYLIRCLTNYWRWMAEGYQEGKYDTYHHSITYNLSTNDYSFSLQISDSPEGDSWWQGRFKVGSYLGGTILEITDSNFTRR